MNLTRRFRTARAGSRYGATAVMTFMLLVMAVVGATLTCSVHVGEHAHDVGQLHSGAQPHSGGEVQAVHDAAIDEVDAVELVGGSSPGCSDHDTVPAQSFSLSPPPSLLATMPERTISWLAPVVVRLDHRPNSSVAVAAAPSLHALGISRT